MRHRIKTCKPDKYRTRNQELTGPRAISDQGSNVLGLNEERRSLHQTESKYVLIVEMGDGTVANSGHLTDRKYLDTNLKQHSEVNCEIHASHLSLLTSMQRCVRSLAVDCICPSATATG